MQTIGWILMKEKRTFIKHMSNLNNTYALYLHGKATGNVNSMRGFREGGGGGGGGSGLAPLKNHKIIWFLSNSDTDPLKKP